MKDEADTILELLPKDQWDSVMNQPDCDIEPVFMGFTNIYRALAGIIPKHYEVVDLGCAYNPQCFLFAGHKHYHAVDQSDIKKFKAENCTIYNKTIADFIKEDLGKFNLEETFAICSYVPPWGDDNMKLVRESFINCFVYYPAGFTRMLKI